MRLYTYKHEDAHTNTSPFLTFLYLSFPFPSFTRTPGKWHLGGMREENRIDRTEKDQCHFPSPNQHGFEEYVSGNFYGNPNFNYYVNSSFYNYTKWYKSM